jgi:hypothetical protein
VEAAVTLDQLFNELKVAHLTMDAFRYQQRIDELKERFMREREAKP